MVVLRRKIPGLSGRSLLRFLAKAERAAGLRGEVNVLVAGSRELRDLNRRFRGKAQPTDVLSFPPPPRWQGWFAGDVAISADIARHNARRLGHPAAQEVQLLLLHGLLHLAGLDHERDQGEMARKEERLRRQLGLPAALIGRHGGGTGLPTSLAKTRSRGFRKSRA